jgi:hypothetical protein
MSKTEENISDITYCDSFEDFNKWFSDSFLIRNGGFSPTHVKHWFNRVTNSHFKLREFLGGTRVTRTYKLEANQNPAGRNEIEPIADKILSILPDYLVEYGYNRDIFLLPSIPDGTHRATKVSKHVRTYATVRLKFDENIKDKLAEIDKALSELGAIWARSRVSTSELEIELSTSAKAFCLLGHYGPDQDSCFRQGSNSDKDKYILSQSENTFVISIAKYNKDSGKKENVARCFGFTDKKFETFYLSNYYFTNGFPEGDALESFRLLFKDIWKTDVEFHEGKTNVGEYIYPNEYGNWAFTKGVGSEATNGLLTSNVSFIKIFICLKCGIDKYDDRDWQEVDDVPICKSCSISANICELSGKLTNKKLVEFVDDTGTCLLVHPDVIHNEVKCTFCRKPCKPEYINDIGNICISCYELNFSSCDCCEKVIFDAELSDVLEYELCNKCLKKDIEEIENLEIASAISIYTAGEVNVSA